MNRDMAASTEKINQTILAFDEIREEPIQVQEVNGNLKDAICDACFIRTLSSVGANIALYLCYICDKYLCQYCFKGHESHRFIKESEKDGHIESFLEAIRNESERGEMFKREDVSMIERVNVKHELDMSDDCWISGICGLNDTKWVVCDYHNSCIKIFSIGSHILQRYLRFGSEPRCVTEIKIKREQAEQEVITCSDISVTNQAKLDKHGMLAVTVPGKRRVFIINITQKPAVITKCLKTGKDCRSIYFSEDKIFTICSHDGVYPDGSWFVSVMSTDGVTIKTINTDLNRWSYPYLAVCPGRIYITDPDNNRVYCMNDEGKVVSDKTLERSWPRGISVDPDTNQVYVCAREFHHKIYRLDYCLEGLEILFDLKSVNLNWSDALCLYRDKLYVNHDNIVTVIRVL